MGLGHTLTVLPRYRAFNAGNVVSKLMDSAAQVTTESSASGIAALDLVSADDILGVDSDLQRAFVLDRYGTFGASAFGHHPFATN
jgi:hypothetical protein